MKTKHQAKRRDKLTKTIPAVRVTSEVYEVFNTLATEEKRRLSEAVRIALEEQAQRVKERGSLLAA
jgi:hypothetical protein